jgi:hypothetical protein
VLLAVKPLLDKTMRLAVDTALAVKCAVVLAGIVLVLKKPELADVAGFKMTRSG